MVNAPKASCRFAATVGGRGRAILGVDSHLTGSPMASFVHARGRRRPKARLLLPLVVLAGFATLATAVVAYLLWPRWPGAAVRLDAPALPITVGGTTFNVPPAAIRMPVQRHPGAQERVDLGFLWPSLLPPDPASKPTAGTVANPFDRIFITIADPDGELAPEDRLKTIYPRYLEKEPSSGPEGLLVLAFRAGTPYQGEDLIYDPSAPERFAVRCTRTQGPALGTCLSERRIGGADVTVRVLRDWLEDWHAVAGGIDKLLAGLRGSAG